MAHGSPCVTGPGRKARTEPGRKSVCPSRVLVLVFSPMMLTVVLAACAWVVPAFPLQAAEREYDEPDVILAIKEKAFQVVKGNAAREDSHVGFSLAPGENIILELRNEDQLPHEFVSPVFTQVEFQFWGNATLVYTYTATAAESEVEIVIREGGQPRLKGHQTHGRVIELVAGQPAVLAFRNDDTVPREFVSPLFTRAEIRFAGRATGIVRKDAVGFRLNPGSALTLQFMTPYTGFPKMYDLIWCSHEHGHEPETDLEELLVVMTKEQEAPRGVMQDGLH